MALSDTQKEWGFILWKRGYSQEMIARRLNVHQTAVSKLKKKENWEKRGKGIKVSYQDIIENALQFIAERQIELESGRYIEQGRKRAPLTHDEIDFNVRCIKYTADTILTMEKLNLEVDIRNQMQSLKHHMEWLKEHYPAELELCEKAQEHYDELNDEL